MPHGGLALANSLATGLESIALILLMRKRLNGLGGGYIWKGVAVSALVTLLMGAVVLGWGGADGWPLEPDHPLWRVGAGCGGLWWTDVGAEDA